MRPETLCSILCEANLASDDDSSARLKQMDASGPTLQQAAAILQRQEDELLESILAVLAPSLQEASLINLEHQPAALEQVTAHDAWDYLILPIAFDADGTLLCVTTTDTLSITVAFLLNHTSQPFRLQLADVGPLEQYIAERYHYEGVMTDAA